MNNPSNNATTDYLVQRIQELENKIKQLEIVGSAEHTGQSLSNGVTPGGPVVHPPVENNLPRTQTDPVNGGVFQGMQPLQPNVAQPSPPPTFPEVSQHTSGYAQATTPQGNQNQNFQQNNIPNQHNAGNIAPQGTPRKVFTDKFPSGWGWLYPNGVLIPEGKDDYVMDAMGVGQRRPTDNEQAQGIIHTRQLFEGENKKTEFDGNEPTAGMSRDMQTSPEEMGMHLQQTKQHYVQQAQRTLQSGWW